MTSQTHTHLLQECRTCGGGAPVDVHFCPSCTKILTIGRQGDYFSFLGLPRKLNLDPAAVEQQFRALSRQFHPDYFYNATPTERRASLERSSYLNDAYRTLKQPASRVAYLLDVEGALKPSDHEAGKKVPASLLEEVFALNEELDEVRDMRNGGAPEAEWRARLAAAAAPIEAKRAEHEAQLGELSNQWDALPPGDQAARTAVLGALRERVLERNYITNLLATIERETTGVGGPQL
ncbi:MAG: Fe-S protein assembly co-chaperone HscB [Vicinamibacterales bacterium]